MNKNVLDTDLSGKVAVVTGAGGVLCSAFAKTLARAGAKVALLDLNEEAAQSFADEITAEGGVAKAYKCNVLDKAVCYEVADARWKRTLANATFWSTARAATIREPPPIRNTLKQGDIDADTKSFFDLDASGVEFVFNLNFLGTLIPTQAFARQMVGREGCNIINISSMNAYTPLTKIPAYSGAKAAISNFTQWLAVHFSKVGIRCQRHRPRLLLPPSRTPLCCGTRTARPRRAPARSLPPPRWAASATAEELDGAAAVPAEQRGRLLHHRASCIPIDGGFSAYSGV